MKFFLVKQQTFSSCLLETSYKIGLFSLPKELDFLAHKIWQNESITIIIRERNEQILNGFLSIQLLKVSFCNYYFNSLSPQLTKFWKGDHARKWCKVRWELCKDIPFTRIKISTLNLMDGSVVELRECQSGSELTEFCGNLLIENMKNVDKTNHLPQFKDSSEKNYSLKITKEISILKIKAFEPRYDSCGKLGLHLLNYQEYLECYDFFKDKKVKILTNFGNSGLT